MPPMGYADISKTDLVGALQPSGDCGAYSTIILQLQGKLMLREKEKKNAINGKETIYFF